MAHRSPPLDETSSKVEFSSNTKSSPEYKSTSKSVLLAVFTLGLILRGSVLLFNSDALRQDPDAYQAIAETLAANGVFGLTTPDGQVIATSFRPPLFPAILSLLIDREGTVDSGLLAVFHLIIGLLTAVFTYLGTRSLLSRRCGSSITERISLFAAVLVLIDPILIQQSTVAMTETLAAFFVSGLFYCYSAQLSNPLRWRFTLSQGLLFTLAYFCRPTFLAWALVLLLGETCFTLLVTKDKLSQERWKRLLHIATVASFLFIAVSSWKERNRQATGYPVWATTHGGYTLLLGNNPLFYEHLQQRGMLDRWDATQFTEAYRYRFGGDGSELDFWFDQNAKASAPQQPSPNLTEHEDDQWSYNAAIATIKRSPDTFLYAMTNRIYRLWTPIPFPTPQRSKAKRIVISLYYISLYLTAFLGIVFFKNWAGWRSLWMLLSLSISLTMVHALYWSNLRMRAPAIPLIATCAAGACGFLSGQRNPE